MHMRNQSERHFGVRLQWLHGFEFSAQAHEGGAPHGAPVITDEPDPVGRHAGPSTPAMLAMAVGHCLSASLIETLGHAGIKVIELHTEATSVVWPNAQGNPRIKQINVTIQPVLDQHSPNIQRCLDVFEDYCTVCQSIRPAIAVHVSVPYVIRETLTASIPCVLA